MGPAVTYQAAATHRPSAAPASTLSRLRRKSGERSAHAKSSAAVSRPAAGPARSAGRPNSPAASAPSDWSATPSAGRSTNAGSIHCRNTR